MLKRIGNITLMCAFALAALSCSRPDEVPDTPERKTLINFSAQSETVPTKASLLKKDCHISDFGIWGIARKTGQQDYILWYPTANSDNTTYALKRANYSSTVTAENGNVSEEFVPEEDAYWFSGFTYNFLAIAPYEAAGKVTINQGNAASGTESLTFGYDLSEKYGAETPDYDFDLLAAVAQATAGVNHTSAQPLTFWHLFSQINIEVTFGDDAGGSVSQMRLKNVDQDITYTIASDDGDINVSSVNESRVCTVNPLVFGPSDDSKWTLNIVPQNISDFEMYIDFVIGTGDSAVTYTDFKLNLNPSGSTNPTDYAWNNQYNWKIVIGPKAHISFTVVVEEWIEASVPDDDDDNNNDIEII